MYKLDDRYKNCAKCYYKQYAREHLVVILKLDEIINCQYNIDFKIKECLYICRTLEDLGYHLGTPRKYSCKNCDNRTTLKSTQTSFVHLLNAVYKYETLYNFLSANKFDESYIKQVQKNFINDVTVCIGFYSFHAEGKGL